MHAVSSERPTWDFETQLWTAVLIRVVRAYPELHCAEPITKEAGKALRS